ncbi:nickel/cobalt efflux protein RcnA [Methyloligella halotolerans]|uniref:Nickel/cobalt efflux system n=1 Tax=Methyloligella halotolerans TaxID=1177755 RepID=A0A1E2RVJ0_9HYPH|nr:nickel/cobalt transporter [Methyloligella halotolerans]ODA66233.1 nickel/cobalt efflux protein RcnA [Methyloligella halotolerans]
MQKLIGCRAACLWALLTLLACGLGQAMAQQSPPSAFGSPAERNASPPSAFGNRAATPDKAVPEYQSRFGGVIGWITTQQQKIQQSLATSIRDLRDGNPLYAAFMLAALSFGYGVLHAAGPGHGKTIITSYVVANEETARRGILVSFLAAAVQATTAVVLVLVLAVLLKATGFEMKAWAARLETASYALIALVGIWLLVRQLRALFAKPAGTRQDDTGERVHVHDEDHGHEHHHHAHHDHEHCDACHHMPDLEKLAQPLNLKQLAAVVFSVGIRPCTGAIVVLVFALAQGLFWAGIAATFAMAFGTALTVAAIAIVALFSREMALKLGGEGGRWGEAVWTVCGLGGSVVIILFGAILFMASLGPARPF